MSKPTMPVKQSVRGPRPYRWTVREFYKLGAAGFLGERFELIDGVIYEMMAINPPHATSVQLTYDVLQPVFAVGHHVRMQQPLHLGRRSEPIPDIAVVTGTIRDYLKKHPTSSRLLVEVSDTTLWYDRRRKGGLYARADIADYWIVNLKKRQLEVYRDPVADATVPYGFRYGDVTVLQAADSVSPLAAPASRIPIADLLP